MNSKYLTDYHPPENTRDLEQLEVMFKEIELLIRKRHQPSTGREHVLMRLMEASLMTKELFKGTFEEDEQESSPRTKSGSYIIE